ncbi:MAG: tetratricopeptide repeat protein, partial [Candidatus Latescibacteria bacterium]|nr:tetratricopeptide repeat protein [Candidatus Latescibacterota bacterium]
MKRYILLAILLVTTSFAHAAERPTVAILPFGIAKDRKSLKWLSFATASTLTETLRRIPSVRPLPFANVVQELQSAGIDPHQASWTPAVATEPLGQWLKADRVLLGAIGKKNDYKIANIILQAQTPPTPTKGTQIWLAARVVDINNDQTLGKAYVEGHIDNIFNLQQELLIQLSNALNLDAHQTTRSHMSETSLKVYQYTAEAEQHILTLPTLTTEKQQSRTLKRAIKAVERALKRNPESAMAHTLQGTLYGIQNQPKSATQAFETAIEKDPGFRTPHYGLVDLALQQEDLPQAVRMLETITQIAPYDDDAFHLQGTVYRLLDQPKQALSAYQNALKAYKNRPETRYEAGLIYLSQNQTRKAILALQQAVEQIPGELIYQ